MVAGGVTSIFYQFRDEDKCLFKGWYKEKEALHITEEQEGEERLRGKGGGGGG